MKQTNKNKQTLFTQDNTDTEEIESPLPDPSVTQNYSYPVTQPEEHDAIEQQNREKIQTPMNIQPL